MKTGLSSPRISGLIKDAVPGSDLRSNEDRGSTLAFYFMMGLVVLGVLCFIVLTFII